MHVCESYCRLSIGQSCPHLHLSSQIKHAAAYTCILKARGGHQRCKWVFSWTQTQCGCTSLISKELEFPCNIHAGTLFWWEKPIQKNALASHMEERWKLPTWFFESCEDGLSAGVLGICELHHTVVISLVEAKHSAGVICFCKGRAEK